MSAERPLKVGLNLLYLIENSGGSGRYARELIRGILTLEPETRITAFVNSEVPEDLVAAPWAEEVDFVRFPVKVSNAGPANAIFTVGAQWGVLPGMALKRRLDVVHGLANLIPPLSPGVSTVATLLDVTWIHYPETMERRATIGMKLLAPLCARSADRVIAISEAAKSDIVETIGLDPEKIDVTPLGVRLGETTPALGGEEVRKRFDLGPGPLVLSVAQKRPHKNLANLIRAVASLPDARLVLPGSPTPHEEELRGLAAELGIGDRVRFPAWISDEELEGLYAEALCFVLPSFMEGFGLPILEAMRRSVPVACSNVSSLPEVAGDAAAYFDPHRPDEIAAAIGKILSGGPEIQALVERGHERCRFFTWERTAAETLVSYRRAIRS